MLFIYSSDKSVLPFTFCVGQIFTSKLFIKYLERHSWLKYFESWNSTNFDYKFNPIGLVIIKNATHIAQWRKSKSCCQCEDLLSGTWYYLSTFVSTLSASKFYLALVSLVNPTHHNFSSQKKRKIDQISVV